MTDGGLAREYVRLALRAERVLPGLVDAYCGDAVTRARVAAEFPPNPADLADAVARLRGRLRDSPLPESRREFLDRQLIALRCALRAKAGSAPSFAEELRAYFDLDAVDAEVRLGDPDRYRQAHAELAELLPGGGPLAARMAAYRKREELPVARVGPAAEALSAALAARTTSVIPLPSGEQVYYEIAGDRPWSGFNHYLGGYRSRVLINWTAAGRGSALARLVAHEAYPGHHTERCRGEAGLVRERGLVEHSISLLNTPQCLLSEGLAEHALVAVAGKHWGRWVEQVLADVGIRLDGELAQRVEGAVASLRGVRQDAALLLHDRGASDDEVVAYLCRWLLLSESRARQILRFLTHPLWRAYTTSYVAGHRLVGEWLAARPAGQSMLTRYRRLLDEPMTPTALRAELKRARPGLADPADPHDGESES